MTHLIVFSHLRWDFVYQRPQHLLSRLSKNYKVLFIEEPILDKGEARFERSSPWPNVEILRPHTGVEAIGFHDDQWSVLRPLLAHYLEENQIDDYLVWFYTPMALPLLSQMQPKAVIYDCMDELSAFDHAPKQMRQRECALIQSADLVLTGGPSLYEAKKSLHPNVLCLPSAVDAQHYMPRQALALPARVQQADALQGHIAHPRLGFFGVIDERMDLGLIDALARAEPSWQLVMVGPVVKINPADLPRHPNVHWLGQQSYDILPQLVAGWDVCLLPFALNESTRFISPTKTLEYLAAEKAVVSTAIRDVVGMYGDVVGIGEDTASFIDQCRAALAQSDEQRVRTLLNAQGLVARLTWDNTAAAIHAAIEQVLAEAASDEEIEAESDALTMAHLNGTASSPVSEHADSYAAEAVLAVRQAAQGTRASVSPMMRARLG